MSRSTDVGLRGVLSSGSSLLNHAPRRGGHSLGGLLPPFFSHHAVLPCLSAHSSLHNRVKYLTLKRWAACARWVEADLPLVGPSGATGGEALLFSRMPRGKTSALKSAPFQREKVGKSGSPARSWCWRGVLEPVVVWPKE